MWRALMAGCLFVAGTARAQLLDESFESGALDAGGWSLATSLAGSSLSVTAQAAHRGQYGFRMQDTGTGVKGQPGTSVSRSLSAQPTALYSRAWVRLQGWNGQGDGIGFLLVTAPQGAMVGSVYGWNTDYETALLLNVQAYSAQARYDYRSQATATLLNDAGWHLIEAASWGIGTDGGLATAYVDGREAARLGPFANFPDQPSSVFIGEPWISIGGTGNFAGTLDMDDLRIAIDPLASALALTAQGTPAAGHCFGVIVSLSASAPLPDAGAASGLLAPYDITAMLGGAVFYADEQCAQEATTVVLRAGTSSATLYARVADAGELSLAVSQAPPADLLPGHLLVQVLPAGAGEDGGTDGGVADRSYFALQCGQGSSGEGPLIALVLTLALTLARSRARRRPSHSRPGS